MKSVRVSDMLYKAAEGRTAKSGRSIDDQIEHWAMLGLIAEMQKRGEFARLERNPARSVSSLLNSVDTEEGRERLSRYLQGLPYPHYEAHPHRKGVLIQIQSDGTRTAGRFVNREFVPVTDPDMEESR